MTKIIDVDVVVGKPKEVKLKGVIYKVPADMPVELYLRVNNFDPAAEEKEVIQGLYNDLLGLFREYQPELESLPLGLVQMMATIPLIYNAGDDDEAPKGRTPVRRGSKRTTSRKTTRASRS